jgi:hypothetical protein
MYVWIFLFAFFQLIPETQALKAGFTKIQNNLKQVLTKLRNTELGKATETA